MSSIDGDNEHPILQAPWTWELTEFVYHRNRENWNASYIDLVFEREGKVRRLRFFAPQDLEMGEGLPNSSGMCILDVSDRQMEGLRVRVANFEQPHGAPTFWAARVIEV